MTQELLPCPFCGGEAKLHFGLAGFDDAQIDCQSCASSGPNFDESPYQGEGARNYNAAEAIIAWNTRAASPTGNWQETLNELQRLEEENAELRAVAKDLETATPAVVSALKLAGRGKLAEMVGRMAVRARAALEPSR